MAEVSGASARNAQVHGPRELLQRTCPAIRGKSDGWQVEEGCTWIPDGLHALAISRREVANAGFRPFSFSVARKSR